MDDEMEGLAKIKGQLERETSRVRGRASGKLLQASESQPQQQERSKAMGKDPSCLKAVATRLEREKSRVSTRRNKRQVVALDAVSSSNHSPKQPLSLTNEILQDPSDRTPLAVEVTEDPQEPLFVASPLLRKTVSFTTLEQREYPICLGDNPAGVWGVPISMDWDYCSEVTLCLDEYEQHRPPTRQRTELRLPAEYRWDMLVETGYAKGEIKYAIQVTDKIRWRRMRTANRPLVMGSVEEYLERLGRAIGNVTIRRGAKRHERQFFDYWNRVHQQQLLLD
jgi:hypothetical protein